MAIGQSDVPSLVDNLDMHKYAKALADFVTFCQTPMTIGIQGEWGSGKSTLMTMMKEGLKSSSNVQVFDFETWQYSVGGNDELLGFYLIQKIVTDISLERKDAKMNAAGAKILNTVGNIGSAAAKAIVATGINKATLNTMDGPTFVAELLSSGNSTGNSSMQFNVVHGLEQLKKDLQSFVNKAVEINNKKASNSRIIIFIDDLDRIPPVRAISLLEVLKNFMDLENCVFVIACDYDVVREDRKSVV